MFPKISEDSQKLLRIAKKDPKKMFRLNIDRLCLDSALKHGKLISKCDEINIFTCELYDISHISEDRFFLSMRNPQFTLVYIVLLNNPLFSVHVCFEREK